MRAIKLKLVVPRRKEHLEAARALWTTHEAINDAVAYYETRLLLMRGRSYVTSEGEVPESTAREGLLDVARAAQQRNTGQRTAGSDEELLELFRRLYEAMVPSAAGLKGSAQSSSAFIGPLTDPESAGFEDVFNKLGRPIPNWIAAVKSEAPEALDTANAWLDTEAARQWFGDTGSPPRWVRLSRKGDPAWPAAFIENRARLEKEVTSGPPSIIKPLKDLGLLPLFEPCLTPRITNAQGFLSPWDRLAIRLAVGHLLSWESWCQRTATEHDQRQARLEAFEDSYLKGPVVAKVAALKHYEEERKEELERVALQMGERDFLITKRMTRGWGDLKNRWLAVKDRSEEALLAVMADEQTRKRGRFGDPHLFRWLARPEHHHVWEERSVDPIGLVAGVNAMERLVERSRRTANMTLPDPVMHPRSMEWEPEGGRSKNLRQYKLEKGLSGELLVTLPVLRRAGGERYEEIAIKLPLAPSNQLQDLELDYDRIPPRLRYRANSEERMNADLGSADLLFDWDYFRPRKKERLADGDIGKAYLKLALEVQPALPRGWDGKRPEAANHFLLASGQKSKYVAAVGPGLRVLSVDLGIRAFAACSVFELKDQAPKDSTAFAVDDLGLWAAHERSFSTFRGRIRAPPENTGGMKRFRSYAGFGAPSAATDA